MKFKKKPTSSEVESLLHFYSQINNSNNNLKFKKMATKAPKGFTQEIEEEKNEVFFKFDNEGESFTGFILGKKTIKNDDKETEVFIANESESGVFENVLMPSNLILQRKLNNLVKQRGGVSEERPIPVYIEYVGKKKVEGVKNLMKNFVVLTK